MLKPVDFRPLGCSECLHGADLGFEFSMAFQPIVDVSRKEVFAYEALARGPAGEGAAAVFQHVTDANRYRFDQSCRVKAIQLAAQLGMQARLSINFMPNAVYRPELCIRTTLEAAREWNFPAERIIFEVTEDERVEDKGHLRNILQHYHERGFGTAIDDFGAGYAGLGLLADFQPDIVKLDMGLIRDIDRDKVRRAIAHGIMAMCNDLGIRVIAEGIEREEEFATLRDLGVELFQGYYFARPAFEALPAVAAGVMQG